MKMQKTTPTCSQWMEDGLFFDDTNIDDGYDNRFGTVDSVSAYTPGETDTETCGPYSVTSCPPSVGPYSVTSCPPSVGPDQDAFLPTPHMYAPTSPVCVTSPNFADPAHNQPTDDVQYVLSAKKMDKMYAQVTQLQADPHQTNVGRGCIIPEREDIQKADFDILDNDFSYAAAELKALYEGFRQGIRRTATCASFEELENLHSKQPVHTEPLEERRMSLDEFIEIVPEGIIRTLQDESQMSPHGNSHTHIVEDSDTFMNEAATSRNAKTPEQSNTTNRVRKRTANGLIFSNSDFSSFDNEIPVKRQKVVPIQSHLMKHFKDGQMYNAGSITDEMCGRAGLASDVHNRDSKKERSSSTGENPVYRFPTTLSASLQSDTGQFSQAVQDPQTSSLAAATSTITILDNNGNVVATDPQTTGSHINPGVIDTKSNHNQYKACTASNAKTSLQTQQLVTSFIKSTLPDNTIACVPLEAAILELLNKAAASTISPPHQITHKPLDYRVSTMASTSAQNDSKNQNSNITNRIRIARQETASNLNTSPTNLVYQNLQPACILPPDIGDGNREATSSATTTTSFSFNDIRQQQEMGRKSHLFNPSASTDPFTASTDLLPDTADPLLEETNNSGISCLPVDVITAQVFIKSSTESTSLYHTQTFSNTKSAPETTANTNVLMASDDVESLPGNSRFNLASASVLGYLGNDLLEDPQERTNTVPGTSLWGSYTPDELIQQRCGVVESKHAWNIHETATDRDDRINGIPSQTHPAITSSDLTADTASALDGYHFICLSPSGHTYANGDTDYLIEPNVDHLSASRSSADDAHFSATNPQNRVFDVFLDAASQDSETMFACDAARNVLTDAVSSVADSGSTAVGPSGVTDLVSALRKPAETAQISDVVKKSLKDAILTKRQKEGKAEIDLSFQPGGPHELTEEEQEKELRRKELNKKAARNHRQKKKTSKETQDKEYDDLIKKNSQLKEQVAQLQSAKEHSLKLLQEKGILTWDGEGFLTATLLP